MQKSENEKIWFAHMLRGIACLIVVFYHYGIVFWSTNPRIAELFHLEPTNINSDMGLLKLASTLSNFHIDLGSVGVALFFLISGFVIPFSLEHSGKITFIIKRFFRILPPYAIGLLLTFTLLYFYTTYIGLQFPYTFLDYLVNLSLLRDWLGFDSIDGINWTLEIEVKFYFLCVLITLISSLKNQKTIIITAFIMFLTTVFFSFTEQLLHSYNIYVWQFFKILSLSPNYLTYMLIGVCFYNYFKSNWTLPMTLWTGSSLLVLMILDIYLRIPGVFNTYLVSYGIALSIFSISYYYKRKFAFNPILNFFANISYPLYIIHGVNGYILITVFYKIYPNPYVVITTVFCISVIVSYIHHKLVEKHSNSLGKYVANSYKKSRFFSKTLHSKNQTVSAGN